MQFTHFISLEYPDGRFSCLSHLNNTAWSLRRAQELAQETRAAEWVKSQKLIVRVCKNDDGHPYHLSAKETRRRAQIETIAKHYVIACIWADCPEGTHPNATRAAMAQARIDCAKFVEECGPLFDMAMSAAADGYGSHPDAGSPEAAFGHDFYLTRQGHGVGFWDRKELEAPIRQVFGASQPDDTLGDALTKVCEAFGETCPEFYRGWLYLRGGN